MYLGKGGGKKGFIDFKKEVKKDANIEYQCDTCGHIFESIEVWSHHKATQCPECRSEVIHKLISAHIVRMDADTVKEISS